MRLHPPCLRWLRWLAGCAVAIAMAHAAVAAPEHKVEGVVTWVGDGDSLRLKPAGGGAPLEVRLQEIDAPEICQAWGPEARDALRELVLNKAVSAQVSGLDAYGRTLATLYLGTLNVNQRLVKDGHAWSTRYRHDRGQYVAEERMAAALKRGFNRVDGAVMPRDFRRDHGPCQLGDGVSAAAEERAAPNAAAPPATPVRQAAAPPAAPVPTPVYRCDGRTHCSQMSSCAEATFFLNNCPGVKMDGDHDGVPCERQWCGFRR